MHDVVPESPACYNCGAPLHGPFCSACGQQALPLNPRLRDVVRDVTHELFDVDGRAVRSIRRLFLSPGFLTRELFEGHRVRWLAPIRLYLIFSVLYFAVSALAPSGSLNVKVTTKAPTAVEKAAEEAESLRRIGYSSQQELQHAVGRAQATWMPRVMFVLVPLFAGLVQAVRRRSGRSYPQHVFFALHVHAVWFAAGALAVGIRLVDRGLLIGSIARTLVLLYALATWCSPSTRPTAARSAAPCCTP